MDSALRKTVAIAAILVMVSVVAIPAAEASTGAELEGPIQYADPDDPEYGFPWLVALFVIGWMAAAAGAMYIAIDLSGGAASDEDNAGNQEAVNQAFRQSESTKLTFAADTALNIISTVLPADTQLWNFSTNYWQRMIEYAVCDIWEVGNDGYRDSMNDAMLGSGLPTNAANYMYSWSAAIDNAYNSIINYYISEVATQDYSDTMEVYLSYGPNKITMGDNPSVDDAIVLDTVQIATPQSGYEYVYIDTSDMEGVETDYSHTLYVFGQSGATIEYMSPDRVGDEGQRYTLSKGANDLTRMSMPSGIYKLQTGLSYAGNIIPLSTSNSSDVVGGMVVQQGDVLNYFVPHGSDALAQYNENNTLITNNISSLRLVVDYNGPNGNRSTDSVLLGTSVSDGGEVINNGQVYNVIGDYNELVQQIASVAYNVHTAGEAAWMIFDTTEESNEFISPSSIVIGNIGNETPTAEDRIGLYIAAMKQIMDYGTEHEEQLGSWSTSVESLELYCIGTVYRDGKVWAENVAFTPYITSGSQRLQIGSNLWGSSGFGMVWDQMTDGDISSWTPTEVSASSYMILDLEEGDVIEITKMFKKGQPITEIDLTLTEIQKWNSGGSTSQGTDDEDIAVLDAQILMLFIIVELGLILFLVGRLTGMEFLSFIGVIVVIVGILWPQVFTSLMLGDLVPQDLLPFAWV